MTAQPIEPYAHVDDSERALKYAIQHIAGDRAEIIEGVIQQVSPSWGHEGAADSIRRQIGARVRELDCRTGAGNVDLPGSANWYVPDLAVVPAEFVKADSGAVLPDQTLLVVEITSPSNGDDDRIVKRKRYAEYGAPLFLLVDRQDGTCTLFSVPSKLGYTHVEGPHPFGTPVRLPEPFGLEIDTSEF
jgi:Uma2 family endonuclease